MNSSNICSKKTVQVSKIALTMSSFNSFQVLFNLNNLPTVMFQNICTKKKKLKSNLPTNISKKKLILKLKRRKRKRLPKKKNFNNLHLLSLHNSLYNRLNSPQFSNNQFNNQISILKFNLLNNLKNIINNLKKWQNKRNKKKMKQIKEVEMMIMVINGMMKNLKNNKTKAMMIKKNKRTMMKAKKRTTQNKKKIAVAKMIRQNMV